MPGCLPATVFRRFSLRCADGLKQPPKRWIPGDSKLGDRTLPGACNAVGFTGNTSSVALNQTQSLAVGRRRPTSG